MTASLHSPDAPLALVTGAARGIGAQVALQLAEQGYDVLVAARDLDQARVRAEEIVAAGGRASGVRLDLRDATSIDEVAGLLSDRRLTVLVNNAAAFADWTETASAADLDQARSVMDTNLFGTWRLTQALLPALRRAASSARIVMVGSGSGSHGDPDFGLPTSPVSVSYAVSKAALHALTVKLSVELAPDGILVNAVEPGLTATAPGMEAMGARPVADGARSVVHAALLPDGGPTGTFTRDGEPMPW